MRLYVCNLAKKGMCAVGAETLLCPNDTLTYDSRDSHLVSSCSLQALYSETLQ